MSDLYTKLRDQGQEGLLYYTQGYTGADLMRGMRVALFKALQKSVLLYDDYLHALTMVGGTKSHVDQAQELIEGSSNEKSKSNSEPKKPEQTRSKSKASARSKKMDIDV